MTSAKSRTRVDNPKGRHHHVPVFHVKQWYNEAGHFLVYLKDRSGNVSIRNEVAKQRFFDWNLYSLEPQRHPFPGNLPVDLIENRLATLDSKASRILRKIISNPDVDLSEKEKDVWCSYILSLIERAPKKIEIGNNLAVETLAEVEEFMLRNAVEQDAREIRFVISAFRQSNWHLNFLKLDLPKRLEDPGWIDGMKSFRWTYIQIPPDTSFRFILTPDPVFRLGEEKGISLLALALNPCLLWVAYHRVGDEVGEGWTSGEYEMMKILPKIYNAGIAQKKSSYIVSQVPLEKIALLNWTRILDTCLAPNNCREDKGSSIA